MEPTKRRRRRKFLKGLLVVVAVTAGGALTYQYFRGGFFRGVTSTTKTTTTTATLGTAYPMGKRVVRIRTLLDNSVWDLTMANGQSKNWTAQDILAMINTLKPDVLQRYITGVQNPNAQVPVASGQPSMTAQQFLQASLNATNNGVIMPRISLQEYDAGTIFQTSQNLLSFPINPPMTLLSLDNWNGFAPPTHTQQQTVSLFQQLYAQGWKGIGVNDAGGYHSAYGYATWADVNTDITTGQPRSSELSGTQSDPTLKRTFVIIDFPNTMKSFAALPPDQQADELTNLASLQSPDNYTFLYNLLQGFWDSTQVVTSLTGKYLGASLYQVMTNLILKYN